VSLHGKFEILAPADPRISAASFDPRTNATFRPLFERPQLDAFAQEVQQYADYCVLLTNESSQRITGLTLVWEYPHPTLNGPPGNVSRSDSYYFGDNSAGILPARSQALVYPKRTMPAAVLEFDNLVYTGSEGRLNGLRDIDMMRAAPKVTVTFDAVIFEDGRVLGNDESRTVDFIKNRKKAAGDLVAQIRRAQLEGSNIEEVLQKLYARQSSREDSYGFWLRTFARQLHRVPAAEREGSLAAYAELPELPWALDTNRSSG
jgi:hypothetical protein